MGAHDLSFSDLAALLEGWGEPAYRARQVYAGLWGRGATFDEMTDVPEAVRERLAAELPIQTQVLTEQIADGGETRKALLRLGDRHVVEAVLMGYPDRVTVCVSSQAGCAMDCSFCATGKMGLLGNLTSGQIAAQVVWGMRASAGLPGAAGDRSRTPAPRRLTNVVFMGMGEPMSNYRAVRDAIVRILDPSGMNLGARHVTVSTVGVVPGILRLGQDLPQVGLAVSFHAADDELRNELVPANRMWPLAVLEEAMEQWRARTHRRPSIEWAMIDGVNDDDRQAALLVPIARRLRAHVNLIPMNPIQGSALGGSPPERMESFVRILRSHGVNVTVRDTRGRQIAAACGQLRWDQTNTAQPIPGSTTELREDEAVQRVDVDRIAR